MKESEVIIIGGGPCGSTAAALLAQKKVSVTLFEREAFPRFHIGESLLPASIPLFKKSGFLERLSSGRYIEKYGARFVDYKTDDDFYFGFANGINNAIPMAYEVPRAEFDQEILDHARDCGANVCQPERVKDIAYHADHVIVTTNKECYRARYVLDTSGRDAFLGKRQKLRHVNADLNNVAVFAHYYGVTRYEGKNEGDITIGLLPEKAWTWIIPFKGDRTSVGVVCSANVFKGGTDLSDYLERTLSSSPMVAKMMSRSERATEVTMIANYSHTSEILYGDRWILSGDAAIFLDPIFSSGVHIGVQSAFFATDALMKALDKNAPLSSPEIGAPYEANVRRGVDRFHSLVSLFYQGDFVQQMKKTLHRNNVCQGFTSAVAGDVWNEENFLFQKSIL